MDAPAVLVEDLDSSVQRSLATGRPLLHHLNADTSWLLQLPIPPSKDAQSKRWYNILVDPWLSGSQSDVASWFSTQFHAVLPAVSSIAQLSDVIRRTEALASSTETDAPLSGDIDLVLISHEFTDHMHKQTLLEIPSSVPVLATSKACATIKSWKHFDSVQDVPAFDTSSQDWRKSRLDPLPSWLCVTRIVNEADALYYHSALLITFGISEDSRVEGVIYTPHGIDAPCLQQVADAQPPIKTLAFLHGLHAVTIARQRLNLGAYNGLRAQRILKASYWVCTHDEEKVGRGFVGWLLRRERYTLQDALNSEKAKIDDPTVLDDTRFFDLKNGQVAVLA